VTIWLTGSAVAAACGRNAPPVLQWAVNRALTCGDAASTPAASVHSPLACSCASNTGCWWWSPRGAGGTLPGRAVGCKACSPALCPTARSG